LKRHRKSGPIAIPPSSDLPDICALKRSTVRASEAAQKLRGFADRNLAVANSVHRTDLKDQLGEVDEPDFTNAVRSILK